MHPEMLREPANTTAKPLTLVFERSEQSRANPTCQTSHPSSRWARSIWGAVVLGKIMEQIILEAIFKYMKDKEVAENSRVYFLAANST